MREARPCTPFLPTASPSVKHTANISSSLKRAPPILLVRRGPLLSQMDKSSLKSCDRWQVDQHLGQQYNK